MYIVDKIQSELNNRLVGTERKDIDIINEIKSVFNSLDINMENDLITPFATISKGYATNCIITWHSKELGLYFVFGGKRKSTKICVNKVALEYDLV